MLLARAIAYSVSPRRTVALTPGLGTDGRGTAAPGLLPGAPEVRTTVALLQAPSPIATSKHTLPRRPLRTTRSTLIRTSLSI